MRLLAIALLLAAAPSAAASCPADGACVYDDVEGDPACEAETSEGSRGTALYVDQADAHAGASGREACGQGRSDKEPEGPYSAYRYRVIDVALVGPAGVVLVWQDHTDSTDGTATSEGCSMTLHVVTREPDAPSVSAPCAAPPPDAGWGTLLP